MTPYRVDLLRQWLFCVIGVLIACTAIAYYLAPDFSKGTAIRWLGAPGYVLITYIRLGADAVLMFLAGERSTYERHMIGFLAIAASFFFVGYIAGYRVMFPLRLHWPPFFADFLARWFGEKLIIAYADDFIVIRRGVFARPLYLRRQLLREIKIDQGHCFSWRHIFLAKLFEREEKSIYDDQSGVAFHINLFYDGQWLFLINVYYERVAVELHLGINHILNLGWSPDPNEISARDPLLKKTDQEPIKRPDI